MYTRNYDFDYLAGIIILITFGYCIQNGSGVDS